MRAFRKINLKLLGIKSIIYRIFVIITNAIFFLFFTNDWTRALGASLIWNCINMAEYFGFDYFFAKYFRISKDKGFVLWFTGLPCSGKTTLADATTKELKKMRIKTERLDGDVVRKDKLSDDLGFSKEDRDKNINRITFVSKLLSRNGVAVLASFVSPYRETRHNIRKNVTNFIEVWVYASAKECAKRDVKGMWKKAKEGKIKGFTGYDDPYERPAKPEIFIDTENETLEESTQKVITYLKSEQYI